MHILLAMAKLEPSSLETITQMEPPQVLETHPYMIEFLNLADLAGISAPERVMKVMFEMLALGVAPTDCHQLLRTILTNKKRSAPKSSSRHSKHLATSAKPT